VPRVTNTLFIACLKSYQLSEPTGSDQLYFSDEILSLYSFTEVYTTMLHIVAAAVFAAFNNSTAVPAYTSSNTYFLFILLYFLLVFCIDLLYLGFTIDRFRIMSQCDRFTVGRFTHFLKAKNVLRVNRGIALLFLGPRHSRWGGQSHAPAASTHGKELVPIVQEAGWTPG
jgi:hypothetical protein